VTVAEIADAAGVHPYQGVALQLPAVPTAVEAMAVARQKQELGTAVRNGLRLLFHQSEGFLDRTLARRGWTTQRPVGLEVKTFWSPVLGARLIPELGFGGHPSEVLLATAVLAAGEVSFLLVGGAPLRLRSEPPRLGPAPPRGLDLPSLTPVRWRDGCRCRWRDGRG
jgi:hypothetical protein